MPTTQELIDRKYQIMSQGAVPGKPVDYFGKNGLFGDVKTGGSSTFGSFTARNAGNGMAIVSGSPNPLGMIDTYRNAGVSIEDATKAVTGAAAAGLDQVNAGLRPAESAANVRLAGSQAGNYDATADQTRTETKYIPDLRRAQVGLLGAQDYETRARGGLLGEQTVGEGILNKSRNYSPSAFDGNQLADSLGMTVTQLKARLGFR